MVRREKKKAEDRWSTKLCDSFETNKKMFWKEVRRVKKRDSGGGEQKVKDKAGRLLVKGEEVRERWKEHFEELLNVEDEREPKIQAMGSNKKMPIFAELNDGKITGGEVRRAVEAMKVGKAPGVDGVFVECLKKGGESVLLWLTRVFNVCFEEGVVPADWCSACMVPLYKGKGDKYECSNARGISLLCVVGKVYGRILISRMRRRRKAA